MFEKLSCDEKRTRYINSCEDALHKSQNMPLLREEVEAMEQKLQMLRTARESVLSERSVVPTCNLVLQLQPSPSSMLHFLVDILIN